ncbi:MAG: nuclear transport factor 2 family protein [Ardenticatenaceae bacterium]
MGDATRYVTMEESMPEDSNLIKIVEEYLDAFTKRDLVKCVGFYKDDATINFQVGVFTGRDAIEEWHRERFAADMTVVQIDEQSARGNKAVVKGVITSTKLRSWKINRLAGKVTFQFDQDKFREVKFAARIYNPLEGW